MQSRDQKSYDFRDKPHDADSDLSLANAVAASNAEMVRIHLAAGAKPLESSKINGSSLLYYAVGKQDVEIIRLLVANNADLETFGPNCKYAPFRTALDFDNTSAAEAFFDIPGVDYINYKDKGFYGGLLHAAQLNKTLIAEKLIKKGAWLDQTNSGSGNTALHWAVINKNKELVTLLLESGARLDITDKDGLTPHQLASSLALKSKDFSMDELFANFKIKKATPISPLDAIRNKALEQKHKPSEKETKQLQQADEISKALKENDAAKLAKFDAKTINETKINGTDCLHWAIDNNYPGAVKLLLERKADYQKQRTINNVPVETYRTAALTKKWDCLAVFIDFFKQNGQINLLGGAFLDTVKGCDDLDFINKFIESGVPVNVSYTDDGVNALHIAVPKNNKSLVQLLAAADVDIFKKNEKGKTPWQLTSNEMKAVIINACDVRDGFTNSELAVLNQDYKQMAVEYKDPKAIQRGLAIIGPKAVKKLVGKTGSAKQDMDLQGCLRSFLREEKNDEKAFKELVKHIEENKFKGDAFIKLGKMPNFKERLFAHLFNDKFYNLTEQLKFVGYASTIGNSFYEIFAVKRGIRDTATSRGYLKRILDKKEELEKRKEALEKNAKPFIAKPVGGGTTRDLFDIGLQGLGEGVLYPGAAPLAASKQSQHPTPSAPLFQQSANSSIPVLGDEEVVVKNAPFRSLASSTL